MNSKQVGDIGEEIARNYISKHKHTILHTKYLTRYGEIDIIAQDKKSKEIVFIEVKTRLNDKYGLPREAVDSFKQHKIRNVALQFLQSNMLLESAVRFDVIEIINNEINHIKNAF